MIAALYVVLTMLSRVLGLTDLAVQFRFSEALSVLPFFTFVAVPGLGVGCVLTNILLQSSPWDIGLGSFATFIGALASYLISKSLKGAGKRKLAIWLAPVPNVIANTLILPPIIKWVYGDAASLILIAMLVFAGELVSSGAGIPLAFALDRRARNILEH